MTFNITATVQILKFDTIPVTVQLEIKVRNLVNFKKITFCFKTTRSKILKKFKQLELSRKNLNLQGKDNLSPTFDFLDG